MLSRNFLIKLYNDLEKCEVNDKFQILYLIIQIKKDSIHNQNFTRPLYTDVKKFIALYGKSIEEKDYGYDYLNTNKLIYAINSAQSFKEKFSLADYCCRKLANHGFDDELVIIKKCRNTLKTSMLIENITLKKFIALVSHMTSYNIKAIISILLIVFLGMFFVLLPTPIEKNQIFEIQFKELHDNYILNHFFNIISLIFETSENIQVEPKTNTGIIVLALFKLCYITFVVNFLYQKILKIIYGF